jgi:hypothetical protein
MFHIGLTYLKYVTVLERRFIILRYLMTTLKLVAC